ncbi:unnamed protein product, partial [Ilex paraguariensis]
WIQIVRNPNRPTGTGGILCNNTRRLVVGFYEKKIGITMSLATELWTLRRGLSIARQHGIQRLEMTVGDVGAISGDQFAEAGNDGNQQKCWQGKVSRLKKDAVFLSMLLIVLKNNLMLML